MSSEAEILTIKISEKISENFLVFWPWLFFPFFQCRLSSQKLLSVGNKNIPPFFDFRAHPRNPPFLGRVAIVSGVHPRNPKGFLKVFNEFFKTLSLSLKVFCLKKRGLADGLSMGRSRRKHGRILFLELFDATTENNFTF